MDLGQTIKQLLFGYQEPSGPPQAYTRITRTPVKWGATQSPSSFGEYNPSSGNIVMNADKLPQTNPNDEYMSNILRHESVHALLPQDVVRSIMGYLGQNPGVAAMGQQNLSQIDPQAGSTLKGLAQEAPAYAAQGYRFGMGDNTLQGFIDRMPADIRQKYLLLLRRGGR